MAGDVETIRTDTGHIVKGLGLRSATAADAMFIYDVSERTLRRHVEAVSRKWATAKMRDKCAHDAIDPSTRIVQVAGIDCGVYQLETRVDDVFLHSMLLLPEFQRRGIGRFLLQAALANAAARGVPVRLFVMRANPAKAYYEQFGFAVYDETDQYFAMQTSAAALTR